MIKFLKYELKRSRGFFLIMALFAIISVSLIGIFYKFNSFDMENKNFSFFILILAFGLIILSICLIFFTIRFKRDIFDKSSYITFTINISVTKIIFAKFLASVLVGFLSLFIFIGALIIGSNILGISKGLLDISSLNLLAYVGVSEIYYSIAYLLLILGMTLSKVQIFKKYYSFVTVVLSIVLFTIVVWLLRNIYQLSPLVLSFKNFSIQRLININGIDISMLYNGIDGKIIGINIWMLIFSILIIAVTFFYNVFLIEDRFLGDYMRKYLKYDVKSNMKFFISTVATFVILLISLLSIKTLGAISQSLEINSAINSIEIIVIVVFVLTISYFIINSFYKDLYTNRSILTFSLPISAKEFIFAKLLVINIFFWLLVFLSVFLFYVVGIYMNIKSLLSLIFIMILVNIISLIVFLYMQMDRFLLKRKTSAFIIFIIMALIFALGFFINKNFLILNNGMILKNYNYMAFIYAYIKYKGDFYINLTSFTYYILISFLLFRINAKILRKDLDLS